MLLKWFTDILHINYVYFVLKMSKTNQKEIFVKLLNES